LIRAFPTLLRVGFANMVAYRAEIVIWIFSTTLPVIMFALWSTVARDAPIGRFTEAKFASYFLAMLVARQLASVWVVWELNENIRSGSLSMALLRPIHPLFGYAAENLAAMPIRILVLIPIVVLGVSLLPDISFSSNPLHWLAALWAASASWILVFMVQSMIGLTALYTQQSLGIQDAWFGLWSLLSGYLIPLELMPRVAEVAHWLPFRAVGGLAVEIVLGHLDGPALAQGLIAQLAWIAIGAISLTAMWPRAMKRFEAYGS